MSSWIDFCFSDRKNCHVDASVGVTTVLWGAPSWWTDLPDALEHDRLALELSGLVAACHVAVALEVTVHVSATCHVAAALSVRHVVEHRAELGLESDEP